MHDLLQSLHDTLHDDPTPLEIIAIDDGSTDSSPQTLQRWSTQTWRGGQPFLTFHQRPHTGILSIVANQLVGYASGEILVRIDGDVTVLTRHWASILCKTFDRLGDRVGVIGPKQLLDHSVVHSLGDWVLHPKGYHHIHQGLPRYHVRKAVECDHVMGCFYCCRRKVYEDVGGFDETLLRGQTVDFGMSARIKGHACVAIPGIEFIHRHKLREERSTRADTAEGIDTSRERFLQKWGFDRLGADLDVVAERYAGTPLLWNANVFGDPLDQPVPPHPADPSPTSLEASAWLTLDDNATGKRHHELRVQAASQILGQLGTPGCRVVQLGCGSGITCHALANLGYQVTGTDTDATHIALAQQVTAGRGYPSSPPTFGHQPDSMEVTLPEGCADAVLLFDQLERHPNPVRLLRQAKKLLTPTGLLLILTPRATQPFHAEAHPQRIYHRHELITQIMAVLDMNVLGDDQNAGRADVPQLLVATHRAVDASLAA